MNPKRLNLGCGDDHHVDAVNVDAVPDCDPDQVYDITEYPWPWDSVHEIRLYHVLEHLPDMERALVEVARTLEQGGRCIVKLPIGNDARADSTHLWGKRHLPWTWRTPEFIVGKEHWQANIDLTVVGRSVDLWSVHPSRFGRVLQQRLWGLKLRTYGPGEWCFSLPQSCGEFTITFKK